MKFFLLIFGPWAFLAGLQLFYFDRLHVVSAARSSAERHGTAQMLAGSAPEEKAPVQILASSLFSPFIPYPPNGTIMESLFCIAALILIGYLMIAHFSAFGKTRLPMVLRPDCDLSVFKRYKLCGRQRNGMPPPVRQMPLPPRQRYLARGCASLYTSFIRSALTWV